MNLKQLSGQFLLAAALLLPTRAAFAQAPCKSTVTGDLHIEHFGSKVFPTPQTLRIWLPPGYSDFTNAHRTYPVLYMFDGQNMFDVCPSMNHEEWQVDETLTRLIQAGKVEPIIVVGIDAPDDGPLRASEYVPVADNSIPFTFTPHGDQMQAFLKQEVLPRIATEYRVKTGRAFTGIGGASYGAIAALNMLLTEPRIFGIGLIESPSSQAGNGEFVRRTEHLAIAPIRVYVGVGDRESARYKAAMEKAGLSPDSFDHAFVRNAHVIAENFKSSGGDDIAVKFVEAPQGTHTEASWQARFPAAIEFLFPATQTK